MAAQALQEIEEALLPPYGNRPWRVQVRVKDSPSALFVFDARGRVQLATMPHLVQNIPDPFKFPGYSHSWSLNAKKRHLEKIKDDTSPKNSTRRRLLELQNTSITPVSTLAWKYDPSRRVEVSIKWTSPLLEHMTSRKSAGATAAQLCQQEMTLQRVMLGLTPQGTPLPLSHVLKPKTKSNRSALNAGRIRFERDGLWVVGQEEEWKLQRAMEYYGHTVEGKSTAASAAAAASSQTFEKDSTLPASPLAFYILCKRKEHKAKRLIELKEAAEAEARLRKEASGESATESAEEGKSIETDNAQSDASSQGDEKSANDQEIVKITFTLRDAERELRTIWKTMSDDERNEWATKYNAALGSEASSTAEGTETVLDQYDAPQDVEILQTNSSNTTDGSPSVSTTKPATPSAIVSQGAFEVSPSPVPPEKTVVGTAKTATIVHEESAEPDNKTLAIPPEVKKLVDLTSFRLNEEQIKMCFDAGMEHYDQVMRTVQLRDLHRELEDGFDLFRERGRGRYDMELPVLEEPRFMFLTDIKKAPWMPIVREILGKDVMLIHKGMFLSMPGAAPQPYHQDGVHLTTHYQKPCHAINVFVPLIDMTMQHGPTEFCLGSHLLGNEDFDRDFCVTPVVPAGTPVVFDYRLGHRGLGNQAITCRPILYCTYARAADGKEFRDSVNFSRKRYRKIGDLVSEAPTREARAKKRRLQFDDEWENGSNTNLAEVVESLVES
jgi:hypothetical protein